MASRHLCCCMPLRPQHQLRFQGLNAGPLADVLTSYVMAVYLFRSQPFDCYSFYLRRGDETLSGGPALSADNETVHNGHSRAHGGLVHNTVPRVHNDMAHRDYSRSTHGQVHGSSVILRELTTHTN